MRPFIPLSSIAALALAGCASISTGDATVSVVNSLSFDNAMTGKRDGLRSAWPAATLSGSSEQFPMAQIKRCDAGAPACQWGVLKARRSFGKVVSMEGGVRVDVEVAVEVGRSQQAKDQGQDAALTIPGDVLALKTASTQRRSMVLKYGEVAHQLRIMRAAPGRSQAAGRHLRRGVPLRQAAWLVGGSQFFAARELAPVVVFNEQVLRELVANAAQLQEALGGIAAEGPLQCCSFPHLRGRLMILAAFLLAAFILVHVVLLEYTLAL